MLIAAYCSSWQRSLFWCCCLGSARLDVILLTARAGNVLLQCPTPHVLLISLGHIVLPHCCMPRLVFPHSFSSIPCESLLRIKSLMVLLCFDSGAVGGGAAGVQGESLQCLCIEHVVACVFIAISAPASALSPANCMFSTEHLPGNSVRIAVVT